MIQVHFRNKTLPLSTKKRMRKTIILSLILSLSQWSVYAQRDTIDISGNNTSSNYVTYDKTISSSFCTRVEKDVTSERQREPAILTGTTSRVMSIFIPTKRSRPLPAIMVS